ncbi:hypothetical protein H0H93_014054 [Arthromyces matolae]|nr:hypothetical protein H0H93_014054 [Arthromyces matolae]
MGVKKTSKAAKVSYAERVLRAFSQLQREHKNHSVHIATLRARVKKNAQEGKDKLGPHWYKWVGTAVRKLHDDGILESSESALENITITPHGIQAIANVRQTLSAEANTSPTTVSDDLIWRHLTTTSTNRAKRGRQSEWKALDEQDDDPDRPSSSLRNRSKRAKVAVTNTPSRTSKMTKLQLQAELDALKKEKQNGLWLRESSPLTDLDMEEETYRLRTELKATQMELDRAKRELAHRPHTAEGHTRPSSPLDLLPSARFPHPTSLELGRTQSGSFISMISGRPTPPRSPGRGFDTFVEGTGTEDYDVIDEENQAHEQDGVIKVASVALNKVDSKVQELEEDLASKGVTIQTLEKRLLTLQENLLTAQKNIVARDERLSIFSTDFTRLQNEASQTQSELERRTTEVRELKHLNSTQASHIADSKRDLEERAQLLENLTRDSEKDAEMLAALNEKLRAAAEDRAALASRLEDSEIRTSAITFQIDSAAIEDFGLCAEADAPVSVIQAEISKCIKDVTIHLASTMRERRALVNELDSLRKMNAESSTSIAQLKGRLATTEDKLTDAEKSVADSAVKVEALISQLHAQQERSRTLEVDMEQKNSELLSLDQRLSTAESKIAQNAADRDSSRLVTQELRNHLSAEKERLEATQEMLSSAEARHVLEIEQREAAIAELRNRLHQEEDRAETLQTELSSACLQKEDLQKQVHDHSLEVIQVNVDLQSSLGRVADLQTKLNAIGDRMEETEEELMDLRASKLKDEATIETLKGMWATHVETSMQNMTAMSSKVGLLIFTPPDKY